MEFLCPEKDGLINLRNWEREMTQWWPN